MTIGQRMKKARKALGKTQAELANELGISRSLLSIIEIDKQRLNSDLVTALQEQYSINASWLLTGDGEMFQAFEQNTVRAQARAQGLDANKMLVLEEFLKLSETERDAVLAFAGRLHQALKEQNRN